MMNVFAGERIVESFTLGAVGYVNPYGNYIPRASYRIWDYLVEGRVDDARKVQRLINEMDHIIAEGHPTYGHQCYSKALAAAAGHPVGDVRPPLTTFAQLGEEGRERRAKLVPIMEQLDAADRAARRRRRGRGVGIVVADEVVLYTLNTDARTPT